MPHVTHGMKRLIKISLHENVRRVSVDLHLHIVHILITLCAS